MKAITKTLTNGEIYQYAVNLISGFKDTENEIYFPAAVNFSIQKNRSTFTAIAEEIEKSRMDIIKHYASEQNDENYFIAPENVEKANKELADLLAIIQDVKIYMFDIEDIADIQLTSAQMNGLMFMINEE